MKPHRFSSCLIVFFSLSVLLSCDKEDDGIMVGGNDDSFEPFITYTDENHQSSNIHEDQNLLQNGGLEKWSWIAYPYDVPERWSYYTDGNIKKNREVVYEGQYSAKMQSIEKGNTARIEQKIEVSPGHQLRIRFHYYVEQWKSKGARTYCYFRTESAEKYTISADDLQAFYGKATYYIIRGGGYNQTYLPHDLKTWLTFDETIEVPPSAQYFLFGVNSYYGTTIYVDDCWVIDVTEQIPTGIRDVRM